MTSNDGHEQDAGLPSGEPCSACGETAEQGDGLCSTCSARLTAALQDASWGKSARAGQCPICHRIGSLHAQDDWCDNCHQRWRKAGCPGEKPAPVAVREKNPPRPPGYARTGAQIDKLARLRVMWALTWPGKENPYECAAPDCHETADPGRQYHCAMHEQRILRSGTYRPHRCARCGDDFKRYGGNRMLCDQCRLPCGILAPPIWRGWREAGPAIGDAVSAASGGALPLD